MVLLDTFAYYGRNILINFKEFFRVATYRLSDMPEIAQELLAVHFIADALNLPPDASILDVIIMGSIGFIVTKTIAGWILKAIPVV